MNRMLEIALRLMRLDVRGQVYCEQLFESVGISRKLQIGAGFAVQTEGWALVDCGLSCTE
jgi:hypothetical protein